MTMRLFEVKQLYSWRICVYSKVVYIFINDIYSLQWGGFACLKDRMLEKFQPIKIAKRFYWLNAFLTKSKSILTENVLNQMKIIKHITNCGLLPH